MTDKEAIKELLQLKPKLWEDAGNKIIAAIKVFQDSESEASVQLRKSEQAKAISRSLWQLRSEAARIVTKIQCEVAVMEAQNIVDTDGML